MDEQITLFENDHFEMKLQSMLNDLAVEWGYYAGVFTLQKSYSKKGKNAGNLISTSLEINEESYPYDVNNKISKTSSVLLIYPNKTMRELRISAAMYKDIPLPPSARLKKESENPDKYIRILFEYNDEFIYEYITSLLKYSLESYSSSASFGCCSRYAECSASESCIHPNKLYAKGCQYSKNLEKGKIFYKEETKMDKYIIFDFETTGFQHGNKIIEIAALKLCNGKIIDTFETLVNPSCPIPPAVQELTNITDEMVKSAPHIEEILPAFLLFIENNCLIGHNIKSYDLSILKDAVSELFDYEVTNDCIDTLIMARHKLELPGYGLKSVAEHFGVDTSNAHRSLKDCYITYECYKKLQKLPDLTSPARPQASSKKQRSSNPSETTKALQTLTGYLIGIIADKKLVDEEIYSLNNWLQEHSHLSGQYPFDDVFEIINNVLADRKISEEERAELITLFDGIVNPVEHTVSPFSQIDFSGKTFCLTGEFDYGEKSKVVAAIESKGGIFIDKVKVSLDYLIVGTKGSLAWSSEHYGNKVKTAMEYNKKGHNICILKETDIDL